MKKKDIKKLVKETVEERRKFYGVHDTYGASPRQRRNLSGLPGVMEDENLKEFTDYGQEGIYPKKENTMVYMTLTELVLVKEEI